jgi:hypothetical protein
LVQLALHHAWLAGVGRLIGEDGSSVAVASGLDVGDLTGGQFHLLGRDGLKVGDDYYKILLIKVEFENQLIKANSHSRRSEVMLSQLRGPF